MLARLVEAEIMSPYHGILINTGVGNPIVLVSTTQTATRRMLGIHLLYKGAKACPFLLALDPSLLPPRITTPKAQAKRFGPSIMSGSNLQGRWMPSSVTEEDIKKLREARYLTAEISHGLLLKGRSSPLPNPTRVSYLFPTSSES